MRVRNLVRVALAHLQQYAHGTMRVDVVELAPWSPDRLIVLDMVMAERHRCVVMRHPPGPSDLAAIGAWLARVEESASRVALKWAMDGDNERDQLLH